MPTVSFKLGYGSKFHFPSRCNVETLSKSYSEISNSQRLLMDELEMFDDDLLEESILSSTNEYLALHNAGEQQNESENENEQDESILSSVLSSVSDFESSTPSSSPVLEHSFCKKEIEASLANSVQEAASIAMFKLTLPAKKLFKPNKSLKPIKSALKRSKGLNFIMNSLNGNYKDATIFATEVNSYLNENVPYPSCALERITIPVNSEIKSKYKTDRNESLGGYYNSTSDDNDNIEYNDENSISDETDYKTNSTVPTDAAIIRAFEFDYNEVLSSVSGSKDETLGTYSQLELLNVPQLRNGEKKVRWCEFLEW